MKSEPWYILPKNQIKEKRAIVIGAGLAGSAAAYSLAVRGWVVDIIERAGDVASAASGNPVGILTPLITHSKDPIGQFYLNGFEHSLAHINKLESLGHKIHYNNSGVLELSQAKADKNIEDCLIPTSDITKLASEEASLLCGVKLSRNGLYMKKCGLVSSADLCRANIVAGGDNIKTIFSQNILSLVRCNAGWSVHNQFGDEVASAPVVIIANAGDAVKFTQSSWIPMHYVRGQLTYLPAQGLGLKAILCYDGGYITPEIDGFNYVGATYSRDNMSAKISLEDHLTNIKNLKQILNIADVDPQMLQGRVSFRASVIDRRPAIGAVPDIAAFYDDYTDLHHGRKKEYPMGKYLDGLYIAAGFGSRGLTSCSIAGDLLAAMINNEALPLPHDIINTLNPARFIIKKLKTGH